MPKKCNLVSRLFWFLKFSFSCSFSKNPGSGHISAPDTGVFLTRAHEIYQDQLARTIELNTEKIRLKAERTQAHPQERDSARARTAEGALLEQVAGESLLAKLLQAKTRAGRAVACSSVVLAC